MSNNNKTEVEFPLPCIVCGKKMESVFPSDTRKEDYNQPSGGLSFSSSGAYGSNFDPMSSDLKLVISVCDECVEKKAKEMKVVLVKTERPTPPPVTNLYYLEDEDYEWWN